MDRILILFLIIFFSSCSSDIEQKQAVTQQDSISSNDQIVYSKTFDFKVNTILGELNTEELKEMSSSFIRYSRNQYFAKEGYSFSDSCLALFFKNQNWYTELEKGEIDLGSEELRAIDSLKTIELISKEVEFMKVIHKFEFNQCPLFHIGWEPQVINGVPEDFFRGAFVLLDSSMMWTLGCESIPPEYLIAEASSKINLEDAAGVLRLNQIEIINIDSGFINGSHKEILIHLEGPSDDYEDIIIGLDENHKLKTIFSENVTIDKIKRLNDSTLQLSTTERCDFIGTSFCEKIYQINTLSKRVKELPYQFDKYSYQTISRQAVPLYSSFASARKELKDSIIGNLQQGVEVLLIKHLNIDYGIEVHSENLKGWIDSENLGMFEVSFAD